MKHAGKQKQGTKHEQENDKNNNDFADVNGVDTANIFELDAKFLEVVGGGAGSEFAGPVVGG